MTLVPYHRRRRRAEDQADAALGRGTAADRHPARHHRLPHRASRSARGHPREDRAVLRRRPARPSSRRATPTTSTRCRSTCTARSSTTSSSRCSGSTSRPPDLAEWEALVEHIDACDSAGDDRARRQVRAAARRVPLRVGGAQPRRHLPRAASSTCSWIDSEELDAEDGRGATLAASTASSCPAASASAASRARSRPSATPARTACRSSASASACSAPSIEFARDVLRHGRRQLHRVRPRDRRTRSSTSCPSRRTSTDMGGTMRLGASHVKLVAGHQGPGGLRRRRGVRASPPSLRVQQRPTARSSRPPASSSAAPRPTARLVEICELPDHPVVRRLPVPPRVQVAAHAAGAAVPRLRGCRRSPAQRA